jgi:nucleoside-diphosphate-sugar epimerase
MKTVLITGVTGFLGSQLAADLTRRGFRVIGSTSGEAGLRVAMPGVDVMVVMRLDGALDRRIVRGIDTVIHCAWDLRPGAMRPNIAGTERLVRAAEGEGVTHQLFLSTYSAHQAAVTEYGRGKLAAQQYVLDRGHAVVRLGIVVGPGGIFRRMAGTLGRHRVIPLVDGGRTKVPVIALTDFLQAAGEIVERRLTGLFNLFNPELVPLRALTLEILAVYGRRALLVPVPSGLLLGPLWLLEKAGIALPINLDNLKGLRANVNVKDRPDLPAFVPDPLTLPEMVLAARLAGFGDQSQPGPSVSRLP